MNKWNIMILSSTALFSSTAFATRYTFCKEETKEAFSDSGLTSRNPVNDKICRLKTAAEMGTEAQGYQLRCTVADQATCRIGGEGGEPGIFGEHDVPSGGWYAVPGSGEFKNVRCRCGCFTGDTNILSSKGWIEIGNSSARANTDPIRLYVAGTGLRLTKFTTADS